MSFENVADSKTYAENNSDENNYTKSMFDHTDHITNILVLRRNKI